MSVATVAWPSPSTSRTHPGSGTNWKPVITTTDAGGPLDVVSDRQTGLVVAPEAAEVARAAAWLREHPEEAASLGRAGKVLAAEVTWDRAIARLLA